MTDIKNFEKRYRARIEFTALLPEIESLLAQQASIIGIFRNLTEQGTLTMSYDTFVRYMRKRKKAAEAEQVTSVVPVASALPPPSPSPPLPESQEATHTTSSSSASNNAPTPPMPQAETPARKTLLKAGLGTNTQEEVHSNVPDDNLTSYSTDKATT